MSPDLERVLTLLKVNRKISSTDCWEWQGNLNPDGYGRIWFNSKTLLTHRVVAYICLGLDLDGELQALHKCDNPKCFNPLHLFIGTEQDNMHDRDIKGRRRGIFSQKDHCPKGHELKSGNLYENGGRRWCLTCRRNNMKLRMRRVRKEKRCATSPV